MLLGAKASSPPVNVAVPMIQWEDSFNELMYLQRFVWEWKAPFTVIMFRSTVFFIFNYFYALYGREHIPLPHPHHISVDLRVYKGVSPNFFSEINIIVMCI